MMGAGLEAPPPPAGEGALAGLLKRRKLAHGAGQAKPGPALDQGAQVPPSTLDEVWCELAPRLAQLLNQAAGEAGLGGGCVGAGLAAVLHRHGRVSATQADFKRLVINVSLLFAGHCRSVKQGLLMQSTVGLPLLELYVRRWGDFLLVAKHVHDAVAMRLFKAVGAQQGVAPDIFAMAIKTWREHALGSEVGVEKQLSQAVGAVLALPPKLPSGDHTTLVSFMRALLTLSDVNVFEAVVGEAYLESLSAAAMCAARTFSTTDAPLAARVADLTRWYTLWEAGETERLRLLATPAAFPVDVAGALAAAPFACTNTVLGSLDGILAAVLDRLATAAEAHRKTAAVQHLQPLLVASLDGLLAAGHWDHVTAVAEALERLGQRQVLGRALFGRVRAEGAAIAASAAERRPGEVVAALAELVGRYEQGLPAMLRVDDESGLSMLEKMFITVLSLLPAASDCLWQAVEESAHARGRDTLAQVVAVLRYVQDKDRFECRLAHALARALLPQPSARQRWARPRRAAAELWRLVGLLEGAFGPAYAARLHAMAADCRTSAGVDGAEAADDGEEEEEEVLVLDDGAEEEEDVEEGEADGLCMRVLACAQAQWPRAALTPAISPAVWGPYAPLQTECVLPAAARAAWDAYAADQRRRLPHRRLQFLANEGWAEVALDGRRVWVTTAMMAALALLVPAADGLCFRELSAASRLPSRLLQATLAALCGAGILATDARLPRPDGDTVTAAELEESIGRGHRFKAAWEEAQLPARVVPLVVTDDAADALAEQEEEARLQAAQAARLDQCLLRLLARGDEVEEAALKQRVIAALKHTSVPQPAAIQARIDALVEQGTLCYDPPGATTLALVERRRIGTAGAGAANGGQGGQEAHGRRGMG